VAGEAVRPLLEGHRQRGIEARSITHRRVVEIVAEIDGTDLRLLRQRPVDGHSQDQRDGAPRLAQVPADLRVQCGGGEGLEVVAVGHHPVGVADLVEQLAPVALDFDVLLGAADLVEGIALDDAGETEPSAAAVLGIDECHLPADRHLDLRCGPVVGLVMGQDSGGPARAAKARRPRRFVARMVSSATRNVELPSPSGHQLTAGKCKSQGRIRPGPRETWRGYTSVDTTAGTGWDSGSPVRTPSRSSTVNSLGFLPRSLPTLSIQASSASTAAGSSS